MHFKDLRDYIGKLAADGSFKKITALVDWNIELGAVTNMAMRKGYSNLLFENIKDYQDKRCRKLLVMSPANPRIILPMLKTTGNTTKEQVDAYRQLFRHPVKPVTVSTGPVKENILKGDDINLYDFPVPLWHRHDGGRYINTCCAVITRDPEDGTYNAGIYRGVISSRNEIIQTLVPSQHGGQHLTKYREMGREMPVAFVYGGDPALLYAAAAKLPAGVSEYEITGGIRGEAMELVKCETSDLEVPASAEIVIEGFISPDFENYQWEGPFGEYTSYYAAGKSTQPVVKVSCVTHRNDPIFTGAYSGLSVALPYQENIRSNNIAMAAMVWESIERAGLPGLLDVRFLPPSRETSVVIKIHKTYQGQARQIALAVMGSDMPVTACKNIIVVDDDIDIFDFQSLMWAFDYRVNAADHDIMVIPDMPGSALDPSVRGQADFARYGGGIEHRLIIDATRNWSYGRRKEWGWDFYPPVSYRLDPEDRERVEKRWHEYGFD